MTSDTLLFESPILALFALECVGVGAMLGAVAFHAAGVARTGEPHITLPDLEVELDYREQCGDPAPELQSQADSFWSQWVGKS